MGYFRFRRTASLVPGVRMNFSKSGVSWTFGPRGMHYTVGPRGTRSTVGIPGTGMSYTTYSHVHASHATQQRAAGRPVQATPTPPKPSQPMLPRTKLITGAVVGVLGLVLILVPILGLPLLAVGAGFGIVGWRQGKEPMWRVRQLLRRASREPAQAEQLISEALAIDADNPEALGAMANLRFNEGRWPEAGQFYDRYLEHAPNDVLALGHAGSAWLNAGQVERAIPLLVRSRDDPRLDEDSRASLTAALGMAYLRQGRPDQATVVVGSQPLSRHTLTPGLEQCLFVRAMAQYAAGRKSRGIADLDRLARLNPAFAHLEETRQEMLTGTFALPGATAGEPRT